MGFQPGPETRGPGRPKGSVNRRTQEILDLIKERGDVDPLVVLSEIASTSPNIEHRITASTNLAPYLHSKRGTIPAPRYAEDIEVPHFVSIQEAQNFLADIARKAGAGELELQCANDISNLVKNWILSVTAQNEY
jgi:ribosomal protein S7